MSNRHILFRAATALLALALAACHDGGDDPAVPDATVPTHTVIIVYPWTGGETSAAGSLSRSLAANIDSIDAATRRMGSLGTCRVMLFHATAPHAATLSEVTVDDGVVVHETVQRYDAMTYSTADLTQVLTDAALAAPTGRYSLVIGSHATGWLPPGSRPQRGLPRHPATADVPSGDAGATFRRAWGGLGASMQASVAQLDSAIRLSAVRHADYVLFDGCYMANIETAYALREATTWLVASTSEVMDCGVPYHLVWPELTAEEPSWTRVVDRFNTFYTSYSYPYGALSATDCRHAAAAARAMRVLNDAARADTTGLGALSPQPLDGYTPHVFFDLRAYMRLLAARLQPPALPSDSIDALWSRLVPAHSSTPRLYSVFLDGGRSFAVAENGGLTVSDITRNREARSTVASTAWWEATRPWTGDATDGGDSGSGSGDTGSGSGDTGGKDGGNGGGIGIDDQFGDSVTIGF